MWVLEVCKALQRARISYCIAGGYAVALHGAVRGTLDLDLVIGLSEKDYLQTETCLKKLGLEPRLPVTAQEVFQFREDYIKKRNLIAWSFSDPNDPTKLVDILITEDLSKLKSVSMTIQGNKIKVVSKGDLIKMKKKSARPQDLEDIKALETLT